MKKLASIRANVLFILCCLFFLFLGCSKNPGFENGSVARIGQRLAVQGAIYIASSCSVSAVNAAISSAVNGDTVLVPAGACSWGSTLSTSKAISILGCGSPDYVGGCVGTTTITNNANPAFQITNTGNNFVRISGFTINSVDSTEQVIAFYGPAYQVRVDNMFFNRGDCAVCSNYLGGPATGPVYGVVDHSTFTNTGRSYFAQDVRTTDTVNNVGAAAWNEFSGHESTYAGSNKFMFFEDDVFNWNSPVVAGQSSLYGQYGGKGVFRHNVMTGWPYYIDAHGDTPGYGTILYEVYNNTFTEDCSHTGWGCEGKLFYLRGGQHLVHDNIFNSVSIPVELTVYTSTDLPIHRIKNTFIWNNVWNGSSDQSKMVDIASDTKGPLSLNVDYFLRGPTSAGDVYYGYIPYTYPHPLVSGGTSVGPSPSPTPQGPTTTILSPQNGGTVP